MTKEELEIAKAACCVGTIWDVYAGKENFDYMVGLRVKHLIELVRNYQQPSLPSNLDEAAEKIVIQLHPSMEYSAVLGDRLTMGELVELVKAGAKWKAGQFQKIEGELVDWYSTSDGKDYCCGVKTIDAFEVPEGFYIRKK